MRVLQISTHTTLVPRHGGQVRSHQIGRLIEGAGFDVRRLAFVFRGPDDIDDPREPRIEPRRSPFWGSKDHRAYDECRQIIPDYICTVAALRTPEILAEFDSSVRAAEPDVILLEHPWTWPLVGRLPEVRSGEVPLVYSSHNVESALKRRLLQDLGLEAPAGLIEDIESLERGLVAHAAGVSACTQADADEFASWGARRVVVAANGGVRRDRGDLINILPLPLESSHVFALAVASGYAPNVSGFMNLVVPFLPFLRPHQRVVVAGSLGPAIQQAIEAKGLANMADGRLVLLGTVDEFCLDCLIANARVMLIPVEYGGGSNLKTAEALLSGRAVVASNGAMRGFEEYRDAPSLTVAEDAANFGAAMQAALDHPFEAACMSHPALSALLWEATIAPLVEMLREIERDLRERRVPSVHG